MAQQSETRCSLCGIDFGSSIFSRHFFTPAGLPGCFACFIGSTRKQNKRAPTAGLLDRQPHSPADRSAGTAARRPRQHSDLRLTDLQLAACGKHVWTALKSQQISASSFCHDCGLAMCSACMLATDHRFHDISPLSDLIGSRPTPRASQGPKAAGGQTLAKAAQKVVSRLSQACARPAELPDAHDSKPESSSSKAPENRSLCLLDVLAAGSQRPSEREKAPSTRALRKRVGVVLSPTADRRPILRPKDSGSQGIPLSSPANQLQNAHKKVALMSPIIKFTGKRSTASESGDQTAARTSGSQLADERTVFGERTGAVQPRGHAKTQSLAEPLVSGFSYEDKENNPHFQNSANCGSPKPRHRPSSQAGSRRNTPRPTCSLREFSAGIEKAFGRLASSPAAKNLVLSRMGICSDNFGKMVPLLRDYRLCQLDLSFNSLTDDCLALLSGVIKSSRVSIDLRGNKLSAAALAKFKRSCPGCSVSV